MLFFVPFLFRTHRFLCLTSIEWVLQVIAFHKLLDAYENTIYEIHTHTQTYRNIHKTHIREILGDCVSKNYMEPLYLWNFLLKKTNLYSCDKRNNQINVCLTARGNIELIIRKKSIRNFHIVRSTWDGKEDWHSNR